VRTIIVFSGRMRGLGVLLLATVAEACGNPGIEVEFYSVNGHRFTASERRAIERVARRTATEVRKILPALATDLVLRVEAGTKVIPETGETGSAGAANVVTWTVNPNDPRGVRGIVDTQLRATLAHEFHHLVRESTVVSESRRLIDFVVSEGLATAFERDFAGTKPPWGAYPDAVSAWTSRCWRCRVMRRAGSGCSCTPMAGVGSATRSARIWPIARFVRRASRPRISSAHRPTTSSAWR